MARVGNSVSIYSPPGCSGAEEILKMIYSDKSVEIQTKKTSKIQTFLDSEDEKPKKEKE